MGGCGGPAPRTSAPRPWRTTRRCSRPAPAWRPTPAAGRRSCMTPPWNGAGGEITLTMVEVQIRSGLSVPIDLGGGPIGTLDVYAVEPRGWDQSEVTALQAYAGVVAALLSAAVKAHLRGALADQLQVALDSR